MCRIPLKALAFRPGTVKCLLGKGLLSVPTLTAIAIGLSSVFAAASSAGTLGFDFVGAGVSGRIDLTYGSTTDAKYPSPGFPEQAFEVTGISGRFTDTNNGLNIVNASITGLAPLNVSSPSSYNLLAPANYSKFYVAAGTNLNRGRLTYDNLVWPNGSPATASGAQWAEYKGGYFDIYGLLFEIDGGYTVNFWNVQNNDYGLAVATAAQQFDYVASGVSLVPEIDPNGVGSVLAFVTAALGLLERRRLMAKLA